MKKLLILFVLFTTSFYGQNEILKSHSHSYAYNVDDGWEKATVRETTIEINLNESKIIFTDSYGKGVLSKVKLLENYVTDLGYHATDYSCEDFQGAKLKFTILHETAKKNTKQIFLIYDKYLIAYDLYPSKNGK